MSRDTADLTHRPTLVNRCLERLDDLPPLHRSAPKTRRALAVAAVLDAALDVLTDAARTAATDAAAGDVDRLRTLIAAVVTAAFHGPAPEWLTDDLWARLVAETPKPGDYTRPATSGTQEVALW